MKVKITATVELDLPDGFSIYEMKNHGTVLQKPDGTYWTPFIDILEPTDLTDKEVAIFKTFPDHDSECECEVDAWTDANEHDKEIFMDSMYQIDEQIVELK